MKYLTYPDFQSSLRDLYQKGGAYQRAAQKVQEVTGHFAHQTVGDPLGILKTTNHGERRIKKCVKYDLGHGCRLITVQNNGLVVFCFIGSHDDADTWIKKNTGLEVDLDVKTGKLCTVRKSIDIQDPNGRLDTDTDFSAGKLFERLPARFYDRLADGLPRSLARGLEALESFAADEEILALAEQIEDAVLQDAVVDTFLLLRVGHVEEAKSRIDRFTNEKIPVEEIDSGLVEAAPTGERLVDMSELPPALLEHYVKTASFEDWMLFLHPAQREIVHREFSGPARLAGVSGSGKTCVVVHRAISLAQRYPDQDVLILTLNRSLATLIERLVALACPADQKSCIHV